MDRVKVTCTFLTLVILVVTNSVGCSRTLDQLIRRRSVNIRMKHSVNSGKVVKSCRYITKGRPQHVMHVRDGTICSEVERPTQIIAASRWTEPWRVAKHAVANCPSSRKDSVFMDSAWAPIEKCQCKNLQKTQRKLDTKRYNLSSVRSTEETPQQPGFSSTVHSDVRKKELCTLSRSESGSHVRKAWENGVSV
ncbi:uncharacterized protein LOC119159946 isoform X4 [Rhipicephalus microplus]|uniref:uncharacterized protein LOC119159946 isoform X4 n=1 Tax=Rhipicephalus microplus TaxID=6941 RepID=UPI003F6DA44B